MYHDISITNYWNVNSGARASMQMLIPQWSCPLLSSVSCCSGPCSTRLFSMPAYCRWMACLPPLSTQSFLVLASNYTLETPTGACTLHYGCLKVSHFHVSYSMSVQLLIYNSRGHIIVTFYWTSFFVYTTTRNMDMSF